MAKMTMKAFEKSKMDKEPKGMKEGSKADKALDKKQLAKVNMKKAPAPKVKAKGLSGKAYPF